MLGDGSDRLGVELDPAVGYVHSLLLWAQALHVEFIPEFTPVSLISFVAMEGTRTYVPAEKREGIVRGYLLKGKGRPARTQG